MDAIERDIDGMVHSLTDAWTSLRLAKALHFAMNAGLDKDSHQARCAVYFYETAFTALYVQLGAITDPGDGVHALTRLCERLKEAWKTDAELLSVVGSVWDRFSKSPTKQKVRAWRDKVVAHKTPKYLDSAFYETNKLSLGDAEEFLDELETLLNELTVNFNGVAHYGMDAIYVDLEADVQKLFGVAPSS
jgi:hypothetical protein